MNISIYPSLLTLIPMSIAPFFLLFKNRVVHKVFVMLLIITDLVIVTLLTLQMPITEYTGGWIHRGIHLQFDYLSSIYNFLFISVIGTSLISSFRKSYPPLFYFLSSILLATLNTSAITMDLFNIYVMLELSSIIAYILISLKEDWHNLWASLKYLMISYFAFTMYLTGVGLIYTTNGSLDITKLSTPVAPIVTAMIIIPILLKAGIFPISMWLPAAHSLAPTEVSAMLSGGFVKMGSIILFRISTSNIFGNISSILIVIGLLSAVMGSFFAYHEENAKRLLAFSTMSHMGFVLTGGPIYGSFHALIHGTSKTLLFLTIGDQIEETGHYSITSLKHNKFPLSRYIFLAIGALSISGIPIFGGFISKSLINHHLYPWSLILMAASTMTFASMLKLLSIGYVKRNMQSNIAYIILGILTFIPNLWLNNVLSIKNFVEVCIVVLTGYIIYRYWKSNPLKRTLEKLDIMVIEYMGMLFIIWLIILIQR